MNEEIGGPDQCSYLLLTSRLPAGVDLGVYQKLGMRLRVVNLQNILAHRHSSAYFNPDTLSSVVVTYTWPLYQGTSAEEFMLGKDRVN